LKQIWQVIFLLSTNPFLQTWQRFPIESSPEVEALLLARAAGIAEEVVVEEETTDPDDWS
jgi:hypothetical protein